MTMKKVMKIVLAILIAVLLVTTLSNITLAVDRDIDLGRI